MTATSIPGGTGLAGPGHGLAIPGRRAVVAAVTAVWSGLDGEPHRARAPARGPDPVLPRSSRNAGWWPPSSTTAARTASRPHVHNIVLTDLTTGPSAPA